MAVAVMAVFVVLGAVVLVAVACVLAVVMHAFDLQLEAEFELTVI